MTTGAPEDNSHAGQGAVAVDIGGDYGAVVIHARAEMEGVEIEIRPTGDTPYADGSAAGDPGHDPGFDGHHQRGHQQHGHHDGRGHEHHVHRLEHVAVLHRPSPTSAVFAAVFGSLHRGTYELYRRPAEPVALEVAVVGGAVTEAHWPPDR